VPLATVADAAEDEAEVVVVVGAASSALFLPQAVITVLELATSIANDAVLRFSLRRKNLADALCELIGLRYNARVLFSDRNLCSRSHDMAIR
jgi:hypothetical protein